MSAEAQERYRALEAQPWEVTSGGSLSFQRQWRDILNRRELLGLLVRRDLKSRYKDSVLGFLWTLIRPLTLLLIYYVAIGKFLGAARGIPDFAIYIYCGLTIWGLFQEIIGGGTASVINNSGLVKKVALPREIFPVASVGGALVNFVVQLAVLIGATIVLNRFPLSWNLLFAIPSIVLVLVTGTALALILSAANVYLRDVQYLVEVGMMVLMWGSPIVYTWERVATVLKGSILLQIYTDNPVTLAVLGFQRAFWRAGQTQPSTSPDDLLLRMIIAIVVSVVFLGLFHRTFVRVQGNFAQAL